MTIPLPPAHRSRNSICCLLLCWLVLPWTAAAQDRLSALLGDGGLALNSPNGEAMLRLNADQPLIPASLVKIPLAQVVLQQLGEDFRFETQFYRNSQGELLIRGLGDPFLVSEEIAAIADQLARLGLGQVERLVMDDSAFAPDPDLPVESATDQPYGARTGALAVNFNTVSLDWNDAGLIVSGEPQTPLTPQARELGAGLVAGEPQRINLGGEPITGLRQAQQLFLHFFAESGITVVDNSFSRSPVNADWTLFHRHLSSRSLRDTLQGLLRFSNNFIANQLFLTLGAQQNGYPATAASARRVLQQQLGELYGESFGNSPATLYMIEGSGLSRRHRSTAEGMISILEAFRPLAELLPEIDGVLRKSGTLTGVYNYAGYIVGSDGLYPFVIMTEQAVNHRDEILFLLKQRLR